MREPARRRLDVVLVQAGLARSRGQARQLVAQGAVTVDGAPVTKPAQPVGPTQAVALAAEPDPWVSRAAYKLLGALAQFGPEGLVVDGTRCLDAGASTGGFTQVLLAHGAREVVALDVGHGQLVPQIAADPRVTERSGVNVRAATAADLGGAADLVVADLSFISLRLALPALVGLTTAEGDLLVLVKPQFEVGREHLGKAGVVRSVVERRRVLLEVLAAARSHGAWPRGVCRSPITGSTGNVEYLLWLSRNPAGMMSQDEAARVADVITRRPPHAVTDDVDTSHPAGRAPEAP